MKKTVLLLAAGGLLLLTSCQTTKEISIMENGQGTIVTTTDMSGLIGLAKMSGKEEDMKKLNMDRAIDTTIDLTELAESFAGLTTEEKGFVKKGILNLNIDLQNEKFVTKLNLPFTNASQIGVLDALSAKIATEVLKKQIDSAAKDMPAEGGLPETSLDAYYSTTYAKGVIERKLNKEKYAGVESDEAMKGMKEMAGMGISNTVTIYNLPKTAKKAEGKNVVLSEDKKKVTITSSMEDFFDDATKLEYRIEY